jgi:hypothetical protein
VAGCEVLYYDPRMVGRPILGPPGRRDHVIGRHDGWRPCPAPGRAWVDPDLVLRHVCGAHQRQVAAPCAAGQAHQIRWTSPPH